jgi:hypothetical protein
MSTNAQEKFKYQAAAKFICGKTERILAPGYYSTAINVHNPGYEQIYFRFKIAGTGNSLQPGPVSKFEDIKIGPDEAVEISCEVIQKLSEGQGFATGFVVIQSNVKLDITAVYTTARKVWCSRTPRVTSIDVEQIASYSLEPGDPVEPEKKPDLIVNKLTLELFVQDTFRIEAIIENIGLADAASSTVRFEVQHGTILRTENVPIPMIPPGDKAIARWTFGQFGTGPYECRTIADVNDDVDEISETNNIREDSFFD